jgi:hypothetical protein
VSTSNVLSVLGPIGLELAKLGIDAARGVHSDPGDVAKQLLGIGVRLVPYGELQGYLTSLGVEEAERAADLIERKKFGDASDDAAETKPGA